jgi:hypothetical protein
MNIRIMDKVVQIQQSDIFFMMNGAIIFFA